jgi:hypothetical protein
MVIYVYFLLSIVSVFKHILLNVFFPSYFMHATYHMIKAKSSKYIGDVDEGISITPHNVALRVILQGVISWTKII